MKANSFQVSRENFIEGSAYHNHKHSPNCLVKQKAKSISSKTKLI